jgi:hypothetical protein
VPATAALLAGAGVFLVWSPGYFVTIDPATITARITQDASAALSGGTRAALAAAGAENVREAVPIPTRVLEAVGDAPVHVDPWQVDAAWAYGLNWRPVPVFQSYTAYTPYLDRLNADALRAPGGPEVVLRTDTTIDGRNPLWESPEYTLELVCGFEPGVHQGDWLVLDRGTDRCGTESELGTVAFAAGETVQVPTAPEGSIVVARVELDDSIANRIATLAFHPLSATTVSADGHAYRIPRQLIGGPLLMDSSAAGWPAVMSAGYSTVAFPAGGSVSFAAIPVD